MYIKLIYTVKRGITMAVNPLQELDEKITQVALRIITFSIYLAIGENILTRAPLSLILSNSAVVIMLTALVATHKKWRTNKLLIKWFFLVFGFVILPLVWFTSKGAFGAQPVYMAAFRALPCDCVYGSRSTSRTDS
jgi:hypothetical protein